MEKIKVQEDIKVIGFQVKDFPNGIGETFDKLVAMMPEGKNRPYYGISRMANNGMYYFAATPEKSADEAKKYKLETDRVEKGEYLTEIVKDWTTKTDNINGIFKKMLEDPRADNTKPCVEWYKNEKEMLCMVRVRS